MTEKYRSDAFAAIHETMKALHEAGEVNRQAMREFDAACLSSVEMPSPEEINELHTK